MAALITTYPAKVDSNTHRVYEVTETEAGSGATPFELIVPIFGTVTLLQAQLTTPGSSTTIQPSIGTAADFDGSDIDTVDVAVDALANQNLQNGTRYYSDDGKLYIKSGCDNAATDATVVYKIVIRNGHEL